MIRMVCLTVPLVLAPVSSPVHGQPLSRAVYDGAKADIEAAFQTDRRSCERLEGNTRKVCVVESNGRERIALAQLEFNHRGDAESELRLRRLQYEVRFEVAKQRCAALPPLPRQNCMEQAQAERKLARESLITTGQLPQPVDEQVAIKRRADHSLAMTRCEALAGEARAVCSASVQARYGD